MTVLLAIALAAPWSPPARDEVLYFSVGETLILVDTLQSFDLKNHADLHEWNPLLGRHPSDGALLVAGAGALVANALAWYALPRPWRELLAGAVFAVEGVVVARNFGLGLRLRLPWGLP